LHLYVCQKYQICTTKTNNFKKLFLYFCGFENMAKKKKNKGFYLESDSDNLENYHLYLLQFDRSILQLALSLRRILHNDFSFLQNYVPDRKHADRIFPLFFSSFEESDGVNLVLLPNKVTTTPSSNLKSGQNDPLMGLFLFDDDYYLFNSQGFTMFKCPYADYSFLMLAFCDKNVNIEELLAPLSGDKSLTIKDISDCLKMSSAAPEEKKRITFLQDFCSDVEVMIDKFQLEHLRLRLGPHQTIGPANYTTKHYQNDRFVTGELLKRTDE